MASNRNGRPGPKLKTCTECKRRHQKCRPRNEGPPCMNCMRRFPPPQCIMQTERREEAEIHPEDDLVEKETIMNDKMEVEIAEAQVHGGTMGSPHSIDGCLTILNTSHGVPVSPTPRNAELFTLFHQFVLPKLASIDGQTVPVLYQQMIVPWMIQSPLMPNILILVSSFVRGMHRRIDVNKCAETIALKANVLALTNKFLARDFEVIGTEALLAVSHIATIEFTWGAKRGLLSHMRGIKQMLHLRGGFAALSDPLLGWSLIMLDYQTALRHETDVYLQPPEVLSLIPDAPPPTSPSVAFMSPFLSFPTSFSDNVDLLPINDTAAKILDDIMFLTASITTAEPMNTAKIRRTASWMHEKVKGLPILKSNSDSDIISNAIRLTAEVYTLSIATLTPFSQTYTPILIADLYNLFDDFTTESLRKWAEVPGIAYWVFLVALPSSTEDIPGRFLRCKMLGTTTVLGIEDFNLPTLYLRAFWKVQRWIAKERSDLENVI